MTTRFQAVDLPPLRGTMCRYVATDGVQTYLMAIAAGVQQVMPSSGMGPVRAATTLAMAEYDRLKRAELCYVDAELCDLLDAAAPTLPSLAPRPQDLPAPHGLVVFHRPFAHQPRQRGAQQVAQQLGMPAASVDLAAHLDRDGSRVCAASWGPFNPDSAAWPAGGVWFTFYALSHAHDPGALPAEAAATMRAGTRGLPPLLAENEGAFAWCPEGADARRYTLDPLVRPELEGSTASWARLVFAAVQLGAERGAGAVDTVDGERVNRL